MTEVIDETECNTVGRFAGSAWQGETTRLGLTDCGFRCEVKAHGILLPAPLVPALSLSDLSEL